MKISRFLTISSMLLASAFFLPSPGWTQSKEGTHAPIISHSFAVEKGQFGYIWKIYIEAEDPDGDMLRIASVVHQIGYGSYPTDWNFIKPKYSKYFKGYLQWNTSSSRTHYLREWTEITLSVSIFDRAGNESNVVIFPFTFETGVKNPYGYTLPPPFDQGGLARIGYIAIDLFEPTMTGNGPRRD